MTVAAGEGSGAAARPLYTRTKVVDAHGAGQKLRNYIVHEFRDVLRIRADALHALREKRVRVNGEIVLDSHVLAAGDSVQIEIDGTRAIKSRLHSLDVVLRYAEPGLVVLLKAPGVKRQDVEWAAAALVALGDGLCAQATDGDQLEPWIAVNEAEKSVRSLVLLVDSAARHAAMEELLGSGHVEFTLCALCHGGADRVATDAVALSAAHNATAAVASSSSGRFSGGGRVGVTVDRTVSSLTVGQLSLVRGAVTSTSNPSLALRRFMCALGCPIAGTQNHTKPLPNHRDKGTLLAFVRIEFPSLADDGRRVAVTEDTPQKLLAVCEREARFHSRRLDKTRAEVERLRAAGPETGGLGASTPDRQTAQSPRPRAAEDVPGWEVEMVNGRPAAYITGIKEFCGYVYHVTPDTLIPRASTEVLAWATVDLLRSRAGATDAPRVLDLGTGSGCVLLSVLLQISSAHGVGVDISTAALAVARDNSERHGLLQRAALLQGSFEAFALDPDVTSNGPFDAIACNPPYVSSWKAARMGATIEHEPALALIAEDGGYQAYRTIHKSLQTTPAILRPGGCIAFEIGKGMERGVRAIFAEWVEVHALRDAYGFLRVLVFRRP
ncbi:hypothetical protein LPJ61_002601 [Coemansia biformis]|uniref:Methyltransferase domain-containing protein n=1 Tax=Coemansia biformis TaxID=1286918 RepID=A0A9W8CWA2_9FUNG|nr:hypothetical protein LPJ61_002601 [Coemansia biformis]